MTKFKNSKFKMRYTLILMLGLFIATIGNAQTILTIDDQEYTKDEFVEIYKKNNKDVNPTEKDLDDYMQLFINYKLKVMQAEELKMDTNPQFVKELGQYRGQLAAPYLIDNDKTGALIDEAYERMKTEVKASHILIGLNSKADKDTLEAYNQIMDIRKQIVNGEVSFEDAAAKFSTDPSAKTNKGDLGYFKSLQMVYPFENAAYNTPVGEVSMPVKTRFGYHLLNVVDKRPSKGEMIAAHIMIKSNKNSKPEEDKLAKERIDEIYQQLKDGSSFETLALKFSDDVSSGRNGGKLPQFGSGKMVKEFEDQAFALEKDGDISEPFKTGFGWHIVKRLERIPLKTKDEMYKELKDRISKDSRASITRQSFLTKLKKEYNFKEYPKALEVFYTAVDSNIFGGTWKPVGQKFDKEIIRIADKKIKQEEFNRYLQVTQGRARVIPIKEYVDRKYKAFIDSELVSYERSQLSRKYPKYKSLLKEYRDGILLFNLTEDKVWGKASRDTVGLKNYYDNHQSDFMYGNRAEGTMVQCTNMDVAKKVQGAMKIGKTNKEIHDEYNKNSKLTVIMESGVFEKNDEPILKEIPLKAGISEIKEIDGQYQFANIVKVLDPSPRPFDESKGLVTAAYQQELEKEWINELRDGKKITINKEVLYSVK